MGSEPFKYLERHLDADKPLTRKQFKYIKYLCSQHWLRAESVSREIVDKDIDEISETEAHHVIQHLLHYDEREEMPSTKEIEAEFGVALNCFKPEGSRVSPTDRALLLLATNRVATPGQLARYVYGASPETLEHIRERIKPLLQQLVKQERIGCEHGFELPIRGRSVITEVYYLNEKGSDRLHIIAPHINYHARPGLPHPNRIYHELCVTSARLDLQAENHFEFYDPESQIRSDQQKALNEQLSQKAARESVDGGCGDFRAGLINIHTQKRRLAEVEISVRPRQKEILAKPGRITDFYAATIHRCFLIERFRGKIAKLITDVREPLIETEIEQGVSLKPSAIRATVSQQRIDKVLASLDVMGGAASIQAMAAVTGFKVTTVSEALALIAGRKDICYCDGFPLTGKTSGRNLRIYTRTDSQIHSIYEFGRLFMASMLISSCGLNKVFQKSMQLVRFDINTGIMLFNSAENDWPVIIVLDDVTELPERLIMWRRSTYREAANIDLIQEQVLIATHSNDRIEQFHNLGEYHVFLVEQQLSKALTPGRKRPKKRKLRRAKHSGK